MKRIPTLDGWRALAILLVLADHVQVAAIGYPLFRWTWTGQHGVTIFFVLSGYLITTRLAERKIDLGRFYLRRFFRLMPAAWTYLAVISLLNLLSAYPLTSRPEILSCLLFYNNYHRGAESMCGHFWSLSLEEQFYLVWPCVLLLAGLKRARWVAAVGALTCATLRWTMLGSYDNAQRAFESQVRVDALLVGCLLALLLKEQGFKTLVTRWISIACLPALAVLAVCFRYSTTMPSLAESVAIATLIAYTTLKPHTAIARLLELRPLVALGVGSYSLYLWQQLFMPARNPWLMIAGSMTMAFVSYNLIEKPCIRLGARLLDRRQTRAEPAWAGRLIHVQTVHSDQFVPASRVDLPAQPSRWLPALPLRQASRTPLAASRVSPPQACD